MSVRHLKRIVRLCRLLVKVLSVKWMPVLIRFTVRDLPPIVPARLNQRLPLGLFQSRHARYQIRLRLVERAASFDLGVFQGLHRTNGERVVPPVVVAEVVLAIRGKL